MRAAPGEPTRLMLLAYALPAVPLAILTLPFYIIVPTFYARGLGLPLAAVGHALLFVRVIDALSDPAVGVLSDRWRPRFGRRRLWFALGCVPTTVAAVMVLRPPPEAGIAYLTVCGAALSVSWSIALVPYVAWGMEMSTSYGGRARVAAWREVAGVIGTVLSLSLLALLPSANSGERDALAGLAVLVGFGIPATALATIWWVPEPRDVSRRRLEFRPGLAHMLRNRPFLRLLGAFFLNGCANGLGATLFLLFVTERLQAGTAAGPLLMLYFVSGMIGVPLWLKLAATTSKHRSWSIALALSSLLFAPTLLLGPGDVLTFAAICVGAGLGVGADLVLPPSIEADVIDIDTDASGEQRAGIYVAIWSLANKLALALCVGIAFPLLSWMGFDPAQNLRTGPGLATLAVVYAGVPVVLKAAALLIMWNFPIDASAQADLRDRIDAAASRP